VLEVIDVFTRRIIGLGIERGSIDGRSVCRMFNHAVAGRPQPKHLSRDHDPLFRLHRWRANLRVREIAGLTPAERAGMSKPPGTQTLTPRVITHEHPGNRGHA
jgi:transposase InsO family protein